MGLTGVTLAAFLALCHVVDAAITSTGQASAPVATKGPPPTSNTFSPIITTPASSSTPLVAPTLAAFPPVGSIPRDFSAKGLAQLWDLVGPVAEPPFTTTPVPKVPIALPSPPPALYPDFFSPEPKNILPGLKFPKGFRFGVATAAYQVEGAAKADGKGPTVWDWAPRQPNTVVDHSNGDISDLHYYLYKEDTARVAALGVNAHSFSISWARIYPFAVKGSPVSKAGLQHYSDLIDYSSSLGVEPVVTLFHWDTPLALSAYYGGFTSPKIVDDFVNYAVTVFKAYNGRIKTWYTFNEPIVYCGQVGGYPFNAAIPPSLNATQATFHCYYNLLNAHAGAVKAFRAMNISGEIALKNDGYVGQPWRTNTTEDAEAVECNAAFGIGAFSDPIYATGDWPERMKDTLGPDILPRFTAQQKKDLKGSADFFAIDSYRSQLISAPPDGLASCVHNMSSPFWPSCALTKSFDSNAGWAIGPSADSGATWLIVTPVRIRSLLQQIMKRWPNNKLYISEFGYTEPLENTWTELFRATEDVGRTNFYMTYLGEILLAIHEDKIPVAGIYAWAMLDNAEWFQGFSARFGIQYTNYTSLERTYKRSAFALSDFMKAHL